MKKYIKGLFISVFILCLVCCIAACAEKDTPSPDEKPSINGEENNAPSEPSTPTEPEEPEQPSTPTEPEKPEEPETPTEPEKPTEPEEPSTPAEPEKPTESEKPTEPETPGLPDLEVLPVLPPVPFDENDDDVTKVKSAISSDNDEALTALYEYLLNADADAFTLVDADNNGIPEVVIRKNITSSIVMFTVAGYADGKIVSESFHDEKYFGDLKYNGWNTTSSGNSFIVRYIPNSDKLKCDSIVTSERVEKADDYDIIYTVCGKSATNEQYNKACDMFYALPDAIWLDKTETNIKAVFGITAETYGLEPWKVAYLKFLDDDVKYNSDRCDYSLVFVDSDNIPELFISGPDSASGERLCSYKNGQLVCQQLRRTGGSRYIPAAGLVYNHQGNMDNYSTDVYHLTDSGFVNLFHGTNENRRYQTLDTNGEVTIKAVTLYYIDGKEVTEEEHDAEVAKYFDYSKSKSFFRDGPVVSVDQATVRQQIKDWDYSILPPEAPAEPDKPTEPETPSTPATPSDIVAPPKPETPTTPTSPSDIG